MATNVYTLCIVDKPGNKGVRCIALTPCFCKLVESLIKNRLQWWCEHLKVLPKSLSGFRKEWSTYNNLSDLTLEEDKALSSKRHVLAAFLYVTSAFNNINCSIQKLASIGCSENIMRFVKSLIHSNKYSQSL